jgi:GAF domain-containing protein
MSVDDDLEGLRSALAVDRVTLRLDVPGMNFPVIGEALADGVRSIRDEHTVDQRGAATAQWVLYNQQTLVQGDVLDTDQPPPLPLIELYGVRAQMLSPVVARASVVGWVSVHSSLPRAWSARAIDLVEAMAGELSGNADQLMAAYRR